MIGSNGDTSPHLRTAVKLTACGLVIATIGFAIAVLGTSGTVSESHADITWYSPFERTNTESFVRALDNLGHDDVERYDLNGNAVFFSTNTSRKSPRQVMAEYQEEFRRQGLNDRIYTDLRADEDHERLQTQLTGGIAPFALTDHRIAMRGVVTANRATNAEELAELAGGVDHLHEAFRAHRYIEISQNPHSRHTSIVATWSDEAFDYEKMIPGSRTEGQGYDPRVPVCPRCTRLSRFADENPDTPSRTEMSFIGPQSVELTRQFYADTLGRKGWDRQPANDALEPLESKLGMPLSVGHTDRYHREDQEMTFTFLPDEASGETLTMVSLIE